MAWKITLICLCSFRVAAAPCADLKKTPLAHATIEIAETSATGWPVAVRGAASMPPAPVCRVAARLRPTADSDIAIEVWMPEAGWNGKLEAVGNGGWSGSINYNSMAAAVAKGYAAASTDTGHQGSSASFALGHPEKLIDYAYRSEHELTLAAKALIAAFYGKAARFSYWNGCSAGGKQGLMEAQRYPGDFDGIVAGSPAANWVGRAAESVWVAQAVHRDEASFIPAAKYGAIHRAVMEACDRSDGVADGVLENPRACKFDPAVLLCKNAEWQGCLTAAQVETARKIYADSTNPRTGQRLYAGLEKGSELFWGTWGGERPLSIGLDYFRYVVFANPEWDYRTLNFDGDIRRAEEMDGGRIDALDPNLKPYFERGGKLIQYHGWSDGQISPGNSVDYYESVVKRMGKVDDSYRLFMVPGMGHCGGGEGATSFDAMPALEQWVEEKKAPERMVAGRREAEQVVWTHPLCPYPRTAVYSGRGDPKDAANYTCQN